MGTGDPLKSTILFDGVCNLCNSSVQFIIQRDPNAHFHFAALQSEAGQNLLNSLKLPVDEFRSIILIENGKVYQQSRAALNIAKKLTGAWPALYVFIIVPSFIRDAIYKLVANNRYKLFGRKDHCMIPTPDLKSRFL